MDYRFLHRHLVKTSIYSMTGGWVKVSSSSEASSFLGKLKDSGQMSRVRKFEGSGGVWCIVTIHGSPSGHFPW